MKFYTITYIIKSLKTKVCIEIHFKSCIVLNNVAKNIDYWFVGQIKKQSLIIIKHMTGSKMIMKSAK